MIDTQTLEGVVAEEDKRKKLVKDLVKLVECSEWEIHFPSLRLGQQFKNKEDVKDQINLYLIHTKRSLYFDKNDKTRLRVK